MATVKSIQKLTTSDVHAQRGAVVKVRRLGGGKILVRFADHSTKTYHPNEHVTVQ